MTGQRLGPAAVVAVLLLASAAAWAAEPPRVEADAAPPAGTAAEAPAAPEPPAKQADKAGTSLETPAKLPTETSNEGNKGRFGTKNGYNTSDLLSQSLAAVLVILVLGVAAIFVVKRLLPRIGVSQGKQVRVLETVYLGPRKSLYVVRVGERTLLVSGTRERLSLLADVTGSLPPEEPDGPAPLAEAPSSGKRFRIPGFEPENA